MKKLHNNVLGDCFVADMRLLAMTPKNLDFLILTRNEYYKRNYY